jgi:[acyl-carrier-protein] S-malonyltransferase
VGEYAAIHTAHGLTFPDGLYLLSKYVTFYQELFAQGTLAGLRIKGLAHERILQICEQESTVESSVYVAAHEQEETFVVMGHTQVVDRMRVLLKELGAVSIESVPMEFGVYSALMDPMSGQYKMYMEKVDFKDLEVPLYANVDAQSVTLGREVKERVLNQLTHEIEWYDILKKVDEYDCVVQIGPGNEIQKMVHALYPDKKCVAINTKTDIKTLKQIINPSLDNQEEKKDANI